MIGLAQLVRAHTADLDADLLAVFGIDLADLGTPRLPYGRLAALVARLPASSWTARAVSGSADDWDATTHLLAALVDATGVSNYLLGGLLKAQGAKKNPVKAPVPIPRPKGAKAKGRKSGFKSLFNLA